MNVFLKKHCLALIGIITVPWLLLSPPYTAAQEQKWQPPVQLSDELKSQTSWFPDVAVTPDGKVHVVWCSFPKVKRSKTETISLDTLMYRVLSGSTWSATNDIVSRSNNDLSEYTVRNSIVAGRDGKLHVIFRSGNVLQYTSAPWQQAWSAQAWSKPRTIGEGYYNGLAIDSRGTLHVIWTGGVDESKSSDEDCKDCNELYYRQSRDGGISWSAPMNLSDTAGGEDKPQIKVDNQDGIHVFWDHGYDWYKGEGKPKSGMYRRSDNGGLTWSKPISFSIPGSTIQQLSVAALSAGKMVAVYRSAENDAIFAQVSKDNGATWEPALQIPGVRARSLGDPPLDIYSTVVDSADHVHLLMVGFETTADTRGAPELLHLVWDGVSWSAPEVVMRNAMYPEWPRLVVFNGNQLHAVWYTRDSLFGSADTHAALRVWYSRRIANAPAIAPPVLFTPTPRATARPSPTAQPIATPIPTLAPRLVSAPPIAGATAWEAPGLLAVAISALFTMLLLLIPIAGIVIAKRNRRA